MSLTAYLTSYDADILGKTEIENTYVGLRGVFNSAASGQDTLELAKHKENVAIQKALRDCGSPPRLKDMPIQGGPLPHSHF